MTTFVLDSGLGNVRSVASMLRRIGHPAELIERPVPIAPGDRLILPGVGAFDAGVRALRDSGLDELVREGAGAGCEILGICLGMQLLGRGSEEGRMEGLGLVPATSKRLEAPGLSIPHMGWNVARPSSGSRLFAGAEGEQRFYFVHSYRMVFDDPADVAALTDYGGAFASAFERGNIAGVQFHPEKSHRFGMDLLSRFVGSPPS